MPMSGRSARLQGIGPKLRYIPCVAPYVPPTMSPINVLAWVLDHVALPLAGIGAAFLHVYTVFTAFHLVPGPVWRWVAALAAWCTPGIAQLVVAYFAWRATGSRVNEYSSWLLGWITLLLCTMALAWIVRRARSRTR